MLGALEGAIGLAIGDDGLGLGRSDIDQDLVQGRGIGGIDVDLVGSQCTAGNQQGQQQRGEDGLE